MIYLRLYENMTERNNDQGYRSMQKYYVGYTPPENQLVEYNMTDEEKEHYLINKPLTFIITGNGYINWKSVSTATGNTIQYSKNDGEWTDFVSTSGGTTLSVVSGDKIRFKGNNAQYASGSSATDIWNTFSGTTCKFNLEGNIMSLVDSTNFPSITTLQNSFMFTYLFRFCTGLTNANTLVLPATTLADSCYRGMFMNCTGLTSAPELPATTLAPYCYNYMFYACSSLVDIQDVLPAETAAPFCYHTMYRLCTSLEKAPEILINDLSNGANICTSMFYDCTNLTQAPSILPATTLSTQCYYRMFNNCSNLTTAPILPATTLTNNCYQYMFENCSKLNYIKCLATNVSANQCLNGWVSGVQTTSGTFVKAPSMTGWGRGGSGIPNNWTIQDA